MDQEIGKRAFFNGYEWRRFIVVWLCVFLWVIFLAYMLLFHYQRDVFEPLIMNHFGIKRSADYMFIEMLLFFYLLWSCCIVSILSIVNAWGKKRRLGDNKPDKYFLAIMSVTVCFAFYYAYCDLHCIDSQVAVLEHIFTKLFGFM